jgi:RNA polymerase sigma-70 factor (ECF subfamily)
MTPNVGAFASLYPDLYPVVLRTVRVTLGADAEQEDVLQSVFLEIHRSIGTLRDPSKLKSWAAAVAAHTVRHELRRRQRQPRLMRVELPEEALAQSREADFECGFRVERARRALARMPARYRDVLLPWLLGDGTIAEIAQSLGCSLSTAHRRLRRARRALGRTVA